MAIDPVLQVQDPSRMLPAGEFVLNGQVEDEIATPVVGLNVPTPRNSHCIPFIVANDPALQVHDVRKTLPLGELVLPGQFEHETAVPGEGLYVPATHKVQAIPFTVALDPALQVHCVTLCAPLEVK